MAKVMRWRQLILICGVVVVAFFVGQARLQAIGQETRDNQKNLQVSLTELQNRHNALEDELSQIGTESYIENRARTDYQFLKPGEKRFEVVNPEALYGYTEEEMQILLDETGG